MPKAGTGFNAWAKRKKPKLPPRLRTTIFLPHEVDGFLAYAAQRCGQTKQALITMGLLQLLAALEPILRSKERTTEAIRALVAEHWRRSQSLKDKSMR